MHVFVRLCVCGVVCVCVCVCAHTCVYVCVRVFNVYTFVYDALFRLNSVGIISLIKPMIKG